jgi:P2-related tail formation protein
LCWLPEKVLWKLLEELAGKMTVEGWISLYEEKIKR